MASDHIVPLAFVSLVLILAAVVWIAIQLVSWYRMTRLQRRRLTAWWYVYSFALPGLAIVALFGALVWLWWQRGGYGETTSSSIMSVAREPSIDSSKLPLPTSVESKGVLNESMSNTASSSAQTFASQTHSTLKEKEPIIPFQRTKLPVNYRRMVRLFCKFKNEQQTPLEFHQWKELITNYVKRKASMSDHDIFLNPFLEKTIKATAVSLGSERADKFCELNV